MNPSPEASADLIPNPDFVKEIIADSKCILLDIEGTTTSIDFVKKVLFPFAEANLSEYIRKHWDDIEVQNIALMLYEQSIVDQSHNLDGFFPIPPLPRGPGEIKTFQQALVSYLKWQMKNDYKTPALKTLQGYIWKSLYESGILKGHVYEDTVAALEQWKAEGKKIYIYSSGSIEAQRLLFQHSVFGDLQKYIDGNFDATFGSKLTSCSYERISKEIHEDIQNIVFFTDRPKEIFAATSASMKSILMIRDLNSHFLISEKDCLGCEDGIIHSFQEVIN